MPRDLDNLRDLESKSIEDVIGFLQLMKERVMHGDIEFACRQYMGWDAAKFKKEYSDKIAEPVVAMHDMMAQAWTEISISGDKRKKDAAYRMFEYELTGERGEGYIRKFEKLFSESKFERIDKYLEKLEGQLSAKASQIDREGVSGTELDMAIRKKIINPEMPGGVPTERQQQKFDADMARRAGVRSEKIYGAIDQIRVLRQKLSRVEMLTLRKEDTPLAEIEDGLRMLRSDMIKSRERDGRG